jgi:hypothetical protein
MVSLDELCRDSRRLVSGAGGILSIVTVEDEDVREDRGKVLTAGEGPPPGMACTLTSCKAGASVWMFRSRYFALEG